MKEKQEYKKISTYRKIKKQKLFILLLHSKINITMAFNKYGNLGVDEVNCSQS